MCSSNQAQKPDSPGVPLRVFLVDDHPPFLGAIRRLLGDEPEIRIVGFAYSAAQAREAIAQSRPDLVLIDLMMPDMNGLEFTRQIKLQAKAPMVIVMSFHDQREYHLASLRNGADAYICKTQLATHLLPLLRRLCVVAAPGVGLERPRRYE